MLVHDPNKWFEETGDSIAATIKRVTHTSIQSAPIIAPPPPPSKIKPVTTAHFSEPLTS